MKDDKAIKVVVIILYCLSYLEPVRGQHICGIDIHELKDADMSELLELRHARGEFVSTKSWCQAARYASRSNRSSGSYDEQVFFVHDVTFYTCCRGTCALVRCILRGRPTDVRSHGIEL